MSLLTRLGDLITAIGADIKALGPAWTTVSVSGSNVVNSTTTLADISALVIPSNLATGTYELECKIPFTSAAATTAPYFTTIYPAQVLPAWTWEIPDGKYNLSVLNQSVSAELAGGAGTPVASPSRFCAKWEGLFFVTGAMASTIKIQFRSEVAGSAITVMPPAFIRYRKIA